MLDSSKCLPGTLFHSQDAENRQQLFQNVAGENLTDAQQIVSAWQDLSEGDAVKLHPKFPPMRVEAIARQKHLVLAQKSSFQWTWGFALRTSGSKQCRLLVRTRLQTERWLLRIALYPIMTLGHYVMERKMLLGIKRRSEST